MEHSAVGHGRTVTLFTAIYQLPQSRNVRLEQSPEPRGPHPLLRVPNVDLLGWHLDVLAVDGTVWRKIKSLSLRSSDEAGAD